MNGVEVMPHTDMYGAPEERSDHLIPAVALDMDALLRHARVSLQATEDTLPRVLTRLQALRDEKNRAWTEWQAANEQEGPQSNRTASLERVYIASKKEHAKQASRAQEWQLAFHATMDRYRADIDAIERVHAIHKQKVDDTETPLGAPEVDKHLQLALATLDSQKYSLQQSRYRLKVATDEKNRLWDELKASNECDGPLNPYTSSMEHAYMESKETHAQVTERVQAWHQTVGKSSADVKAIQRVKAIVEQKNAVLAELTLNAYYLPADDEDVIVTEQDGEEECDCGCE